MKEWQGKNFSGGYLPKRNNGWKWIAGASSAAAAGVTASQATGTTITLNHSISAAGGTLNADVTGDGHPDLTITNVFFGSYVFTYRGNGPFYYVGVTLNGTVAAAEWNQYDLVGFAQLGSRVASAFYPSAGRASVTGAIPIFFKDLHIDGGAPTLGSLQVSVSGGGPGDRNPTIQLDSLTYDGPVGGSKIRLAVPDEGSSLGLLALGAAGVLALRRWRVAQGHS